MYLYGTFKGNLVYLAIAIISLCSHILCSRARLQFSRWSCLLSLNMKFVVKWTCNIIDKSEESVMNSICLFRKPIFVYFSRVHPTTVLF